LTYSVTNMNLNLINKREQHIVIVALAFLKRCRLSDGALKVDCQLTEDMMEYRQILEKEIDNILERLGASY
jgi:hypothetical protein